MSERTERSGAGTRRPRAVRAVLAANLRLHLRDRIGLFAIVVLPFIVIAVVGLVMGGSDQDEPRIPFGLVAEGSGPVTAGIVAGLEHRPDLMVYRMRDARELSVQVRSGSLAAGVVLPAAVDRAPQPDRVDVRFVARQQSGEAAAARAALDIVLAEETAVVRARRAATDGGAPASTVDGVRANAVPVTVAARTLRGERATPRGFNYTAPGNLVLFTFINSITLAGALVEARRLGLSRRALVAPVRTAAVVAGEVLSRFTVAAGQAVLVIVVTALAFGVQWGDPVAVAALVGSFCLVSTAAAVLVGTILNGGSRASAIGPPVGIVLGMLGGCMWPSEVTGPLLRQVGHVFPHAWAVDGLIAVATPGRGLADVATEVGVLLAMGLGVLIPSVYLFRRVIVR